MNSEAGPSQQACRKLPLRNPRTIRFLMSRSVKITPAIGPLYQELGDLCAVAARRADLLGGLVIP